MLRMLRTSTFYKGGNSLLHNTFVLYFIFFISVMDLISFAASGNLISPAIFILTGFITTFFSKNMLVILIIPLIVTNILTIRGSSEGMENEKKDGDVVESKISDKMSDKTSDKMSDKTSDDSKVTEMKEKYDELFKLQKTIIDGMEKVAQSLDKAEPILKNLKEKFQSS